MLTALQQKLLRRDLFEEFCEEFTRETNRLRMAARASIVSAERELDRTHKEVAKLVQAVVDGLPAAAVKDQVIALEARKTELRSWLDKAQEPPPLLHPNMADVYRRQVTDLAAALSSEDTRLEAAETLRGLIDSIKLFPDGNSLRIELTGNLAAMLRAADAPRSLTDDDQLVQTMMVAGGGFEPPTFGL